MPSANHPQIEHVHHTNPEVQTAELIRFLQNELNISADSTYEVVEQCKNLKRLPVILWQRKLVTLAQLDQVCHWLEGYAARAISIS